MKSPLAQDRLALGTVFIVLVSLVWLVFGQTIRHEFINYDDNMYIYENRFVQAGLTWRGLGRAFTFAEIGHWHPVTWISHMTDVWLFGGRPAGHHLINVLLHATGAGLLFLALKELTGAFWRSAFVAAVFAVHPLRVESVAWIAERKDVLSGAFFMAVLLVYARYARQPTRGRYLFLLLLFALGLMAKGMLVTLPFVLLLLDYWPLGRLKAPGKNGEGISFSRLVMEKVPLFVLSAGSILATMLSPEKIAPAFQEPFLERLQSAVVSYVIYVKQLFYPADLVLPAFNPMGGFSAAVVGWAAAFLGAISVATIVCRRTQPWLFVGWFWFVGMMAPVIGLVQISYYARADRYTYLPHIGLTLMVTWGAVELLRRVPRHRAIGTAAALVILGALLLASRAHAAHWRNSETLWRYVLRVDPRNYIAHNNFALALDKSGRPQEAVLHFERALAIQPQHAESHNNFANTLASLGRLEDAIRHYREALRLAPDLPQVHQNLGTALAENGQAREAIAHFERALAITPDFAVAHANLGYTLLREGRLDEAIAHLEKAAAARPDLSEIRRHLEEARRRKAQEEK